MRRQVGVGVGPSRPIRREENVSFMEPWATSEGESVVTDEPNKPIDEPSEMPETAAADAQ